MLCRVVTYDNLYKGLLKNSAIKVNKDALCKCEQLKQNDLFSTLKITISDVIIRVHHLTSLAKRVDDIYNRTINNLIIELTET